MCLLTIICYIKTLLDVFILKTFLRINEFYRELNYIYNFIRFFNFIHLLIDTWCIPFFPFLSNGVVRTATNDFDISQLITSNPEPTGLHVSEEGFRQQGPVMLQWRQYKISNPILCTHVKYLTYTLHDVLIIMGQRLEQEH